MCLVFVLGSNSFSGAHFVNHCLSMGHDVIGVSRSPEPSSVFLPYKKNKHRSKFRHYVLDINKDISGVLRLLNKSRPEYIVNFAAQGMVSQSWASPGDWYTTNFVSPALLHEGLRKDIYFKNFVQISTPEVYGSCGDNRIEGCDYNPSTPYAVSKAAIDMSLMAYFRHYGYPVTWTRAANVYGVGQQLYRIIPKTILAIRGQKQLPLHGGGHSERSFISIEDVVDGTYRVMTEGLAGNTYHLSTDYLISIADLVRLICNVAGANYDEVISVVDERPSLDQIYMLNSDKAKRELQWRAKTNLEQGLQGVVDWVDANYGELCLLSTEYEHKS
jgi:dTDP-glucose 4,6-dehydratase